MSKTDKKKRLRREALDRRKILAREEPGAGEAVRDHFLAGIARLGVGPGPYAVSAYWPVGDELDVRMLLSALSEQGCDCALPVVEGRGLPLVFRRWRPGDTLRRAGFGLLEPTADAPEVTPRIVLAPLLAFDRIGRRLGHGAGYYDMTLAALRGVGDVAAVGVCYAGQEVPELPQEAHDALLDAVVTEKGMTLIGNGPESR